VQAEATARKPRFAGHHDRLFGLPLTVVDAIPVGVREPA